MVNSCPLLWNPLRLTGCRPILDQDTNYPMGKTLIFTSRANYVEHISCLRVPQASRYMYKYTNKINIYLLSIEHGTRSEVRKKMNEKKAYDLF